MTRLADALREVKRLQALVDRLESEVSTDDLTGLLNRRGGERALNRMERRVRRQGGRFSAVLVDLDYFKQVNDEHGHAWGDATLRQVAATLRTNLRATDAEVRWGGEELLVITENGVEGARVLANRLCKLMPREVIVGGKSVTASFGVAEWIREDGWSGMVRRADEALYRAKEAGRNRVEVESRDH